MIESPTLSKAHRSIPGSYGSARPAQRVRGGNRVRLPDVPEGECPQERPESGWGRATGGCQRWCHREPVMIRTAAMISIGSRMNNTAMTRSPVGTWSESTITFRARPVNPDRGPEAVSECRPENVGSAGSDMADRRAGRPGHGQRTDTGSAPYLGASRKSLMRRSWWGSQVAPPNA